MVDKLNWWGWSNGKSGYSIVNLEYSTALNRLTHGGVSIGWERAEDIDINDYRQLSQEQRELLNKPFKKEHFGIIKVTPQLFDHNQSEFRIGYTMVENTMIGEKWTEMCNKMDGIFVPSEFLVEVFKNCGVKPKVISVRQGINKKKFPYFSRKRKNKFVFGTIGYQDERKNWTQLVQAFVSEFERKEDVELWIKNTNPYFSHVTFKDERIKVINREMNFDKEITKLYQMIDCFVFPSHAEGSGLPPREAMATGCPTIVTNWSGMTEICDRKFNYPLTPVAVDMPDIRGPEQPGFMARIDTQELMYYMRHVFNNYDSALAKGKLASDFIHKEYDWDVCAKDLLLKLEQF